MSLAESRLGALTSSSINSRWVDYKTDGLLWPRVDTQLLDRQHDDGSVEVQEWKENLSFTFHCSLITIKDGADCNWVLE